MSGLVLIEITWAGAPLFTSDGRLTSRFLRGWPGTPPMVRGEDDTVASRTGRVFYPKVADHLDIDLSLKIAEVDEASFRTRMTELYGLFSTTDATSELSALLEDGSTATINASVQPPLLTTEQLGSLVAELEVSLISLDPAWVITPGP